MNNYEKFKNISIDEMAEILVSTGAYKCRYCDFIVSSIECQTKQCKDGIEKWILRE